MYKPAGWSPGSRQGSLWASGPAKAQSGGGCGHGPRALDFRGATAPRPLVKVRRLFCWDVSGVSGGQGRSSPAPVQRSRASFLHLFPAALETSQGWMCSYGRPSGKSNVSVGKEGGLCNIRKAPPNSPSPGETRVLLESSAPRPVLCPRLVRPWQLGLAVAAPRPCQPAWPRRAFDARYWMTEANYLANRDGGEGCPTLLVLQQLGFWPGVSGDPRANHSACLF